MDGAEITSEGNQEVTCEEATTSKVTPSNAEIPLQETTHVDSSSSHKNESQDLSTDSIDKKSEKVDSKPDNQGTTPSDGVEASKLDSPAVRPDGPVEDGQGNTIVAQGEMTHEELVKQGRTPEQLANVPSSVTNASKMQAEKELTVALNIEADVVNVNNLKSDARALDNQSQHSHRVRDKPSVLDKNDNDVEQEGITVPTATSPEPTETKLESTAVLAGGDERPLVADSTTESERRVSVGDSAKQTSELTTPSKPGTPETGISVNTKWDPSAQSRLTTPHPPSRQLLDSPQTRASGSSEFMFDEKKEFTTPDYEYAQTPLYSLRGDSGLARKTFSRGDSTKSVTFADDLVGRRSANAKDHGVDEGKEVSSSDERDSVTPVEGKEEVASGVKTETAPEVRGEEVKENQEPLESEAADLFPTAVSEEKIEEAKLKRKERASSDAAVEEFCLVGLFGAPRLEERPSMSDVVGSRAREHFDRGCVLVSELEPGQATVCFDKAINLCPKEVRYYLMRGEAYLQMCDFQSAVLNLKKACVLDPNNDTYYARLAFVYYFQGQTLFDQCLFAEALESFSRASEMRPEVIGYHTRSVACLAALQRHGECLALVNKRLDIEQNNPDLYIMRARLHELFRNTSLCYYDLKDAIALDPNRAEAIALMRQLEAKAEDSRNHAIRLQLQGKLKEAMHKITDAVETNPAVADYHLLRGAVHRRLHDYNAAIDDFLLALDKTDHNEQNRVYMEAQRQLLLTYNDFAVECFLGEHFEEAIILLNKAIKGEKREKGLYINRGDCFFRLNELHFALADYHQALELDNTDWMIRSRIASIHGEFGLMDYEEHSYKEAEGRFTVAVQHNPRVGSYYICRAKVRYMLENHGGARHDLLVTLHLEPNNEEILSLLPRLFPGKAISDILRSKAARQAKAEVENAVVTASPVRLPALNRDAAGKGEQPSSLSLAKAQAGATKHVTFSSAAAAPPDSVMPDLKACMDEISFNTVLAKKKKKVSTHVKSLLHDRQYLWTDAPKLCPQPPARPYAVRGGIPNKNQSNIDPTMGWRSFSVGVGLK